MTQPSPEKRAEWRARAAKKNAIVPRNFEVSQRGATLECGKCGHSYHRRLRFGINEPVLVCPQDNCKARNWLPVRYETRGQN